MTRNARGADFAAFEEFVGRVEHRLRVALVASYGAHDGRAATLDALSWAWEHWDRVRTMDNAVGYLYRVGQSASRAYTTRPIPFERHQPIAGEVLVIGPELSEAINRLPVQQRTVVMLIHAFGWTQRDAAELLDISRSTVREHLDRAMTRLNHALEVRGVR